MSTASWSRCLDSLSNVSRSGVVRCFISEGMGAIGSVLAQLLEVRADSPYGGTDTSTEYRLQAAGWASQRRYIQPNIAIDTTTAYVHPPNITLHDNESWPELPGP